MRNTKNFKFITTYNAYTLLSYPFALAISIRIDLRRLFSEYYLSLVPYFSAIIIYKQLTLVILLVLKGERLI